MRASRVKNPGVRIIAAAAAMLLTAATATTAAPPSSPVNHAAQIDTPAPTHSADELARLVGPIALYPDDLVAIVLPAATYPLQLVQAADFLQALQHEPRLQPSSQLDESVIALLNYPEAVQLLNADLHWSRRLGEAVLSDQSAVIEAIAQFRERAWSAGNLRSDKHQLVSREDGVLSIVPVNPQVIYVPYYEPLRVVYHSPRPVYHYYPRPYPIYYYPYAAGDSFSFSFFWGVTSVFSVGWHTHHLHVLRHDYRSHPYYGRRYDTRYFYRRPPLAAFHRPPAVRERNARHYPGNYWRRAAPSRPSDGRREGKGKARQYKAPT